MDAEKDVTSKSEASEKLEEKLDSPKGGETNISETNELSEVAKSPASLDNDNLENQEEDKSKQPEKETIDKEKPTDDFDKLFETKEKPEDSQSKNEKYEQKESSDTKKTKSEDEEMDVDESQEATHDETTTTDVTNDIAKDIENSEKKLEIEPEKEKISNAIDVDAESEKLEKENNVKDTPAVDVESEGMDNELVKETVDTEMNSKTIQKSTEVVDVESGKDTESDDIEEVDNNEDLAKKAVAGIKSTEYEEDPDDPDQVDSQDEVGNEEKQTARSPSPKTEDIASSDSDEIEVLPVEKEKEKDTDSIQSIPIQTTDENKKSSIEKDVNKSTKNSDRDSDSSIEISVPKKRRRIVWQCINPKCSSSKRRDLLTADNFVLSVYNYDEDSKKKRKICYTCYAEIQREQLRLIAKIDNNEPLLNEVFPVAEDVLELEDSDEKSETDDSVSSQVEISCSEGDELLSNEQFVEKMFERCLKEIDVPNMIIESCAELSKRFEGMEDERENITKNFKDVEKGVEQLFRDIYEPFEPVIRSVEPLDIPLEEEIQQRPRPQQQRPMGNAGITGRQPIGGPQRQQINRQPGTFNSQGGILHGGASRQHPMQPGMLQQQQVPLQTLPFVPQPGNLERPPLTLGEKVFYLQGGQTINVWKEGKVDEIISTTIGELANYKIKFEIMVGSKKMIQSKQRNLKQLAYFSAVNVKINVGTRVIALYHEKPEDQGSFYAGIIAEPPKSLNMNRYLIFFDDGVTRYVEHKNVRLICFSSPDVSEDVHANSRQFIKEYLEKYPERPMVKLTIGQAVKTEFDSKWHITRVAKVDASLVSLFFEERNMYEWLYRGSTRLGPLFTQFANQRNKTGQVDNRIRRMQRTDIEYTSGQREVIPAQENNQTSESAAQFRKANVARKSGKSSASSIRHENVPATEREHPDREGIVSQVDISGRRKWGKTFVKHMCAPGCVENYAYNENEWKGTNPLLIPLCLGWDRKVCKLQGRLSNKVQNKTVAYTAPCGRTLRNLDEVHRYLRIVKSSLEIDMFNTDWFVKVFDEWSPKTYINLKPDLSYSKENVPIPWVNSIDNSFPDHIDYSTVRIPQYGVYINTDDDFLVGCNCIDDCQDSNNCACHQLTIQATAHCIKRKINPNAVYKYRRLHEFVPTGIYECNKQCKCAKTCLNRVAQNPLRNKLQVFKTETRDWGVRTLCDIPKGGFICIYVGKLFGVDESNSQGKNHGDEYFADLDLIENVEKQKEGYESDVEEPNDDISFLECLRQSPPRQTEVNMSTEDESEYEPVDQEEDQEFVPKMNRKKKKKATKSSFNRNFRNNFPQVDGNVEASDMSQSDEDKNSVKQDKKVMNINDLIAKPDPFANGMVVKKKWSEVTDGDILVERLNQVDGPLDETSDEDEVDERRPQASGFSAPMGMMGMSNQHRTFRSTRKFFGAEEEAYTMDAKFEGNIGRYLNHCCDPNCFVQSVFVDTHDLRFHWVAFYSHCHISAGSELHWDYNYEIGMIEGRELVCKCGAEKCRNRLL